MLHVSGRVAAFTRHLFVTHICTEYTAYCYILPMRPGHGRESLYLSTGGASTARSTGVAEAPHESELHWVLCPCSTRLLVGAVTP